MRTLVFIFLLGAICIYALYRGGGPERWVACVVIGMVALDPAVHLFTPLEYATLDPGHLVIDLVAWTGLFAIALRANRFWPLWVVSLQTIALVSHATRLLDVTIQPKAYMIMQIGSSYPLLAALMIGTFFHQKRLKAAGIDRPWRNS
tara:strand:+ start:11980 stop:12420 length:441 start_codon:yes stop_codon:yes gene_type:complete